MVKIYKWLWTVHVTVPTFRIKFVSGKFAAAASLMLITFLNLGTTSKALQLAYIQAAFREQICVTLVLDDRELCPL